MKVQVWWEQMDHDKSDVDLVEEKIDKEALEKCIEQYIRHFNSLPPIGLEVDGGTCDSAKITRITYGINQVFIQLKF